LLGRKLVVILLITGSAAGAFATLGDGKTPKKGKSTQSLLLNKSRTNNSFTLRPVYQFRGSQVINTHDPRFINLNTTLTYKKGATTYILPVQKKVFLDKVIFNDDLLRNSRRP
jgi:hypothetical protein